MIYMRIQINFNREMYQLLLEIAFLEIMKKVHNRILQSFNIKCKKQAFYRLKFLFNSEKNEKLVYKYITK